MRLPYAICELDARLADRWHVYFELPSDRNRKLEEGLWRRTQDPRNAEESGWGDAGDCRRRLIHYRYTYDTIRAADRYELCLVALYLMYCVSYPQNEVELIHEAVVRSLDVGGWRHLLGTSKWERGDLEMTLRIDTRHTMDTAHRRSLPRDYRTLEITVRSQNDITSAVDRGMPWDVLRRGMRIKDQREDPALVTNVCGLMDYLPFHLEVGCGLSTESGIPPLHFLHEVYQVNRRKRNLFVFDAAQDNVITRLLAAPESMLPLLTHMYKSCFLAEPSSTHWNLKKLVDRGFIVGPVMTNNFDGLLGRVGIDELYLRRYDQDIPAVSFDPAAKALLVIGSHADRRRVQRRARERGMKVFFIDPEGFWEDGTFVSYPLEGIQAGDYLCREPASSAVQRLTDHLVGTTKRL